MSTSSDLPSAETLVAELLSRKASAESRAAANPPAPPTVEQAPAATLSAEPSPQPEIPVADTPQSATNEPSGPSQDLDLPSKIEFPDSNFDQDGLTLPEGLLDQPTTAPTPAPPVQRQATSPKIVPLAKERFVDRVRAQARLSILLPAIICLVIGMPVVSWLGWAPWAQRGSTPRASGAPPLPASTPKPTSRAAATSAPSTAAVVEPRAPDHASPAAESKQPPFVASKPLPAAVSKVPPALVSKDVSNAVSNEPATPVPAAVMPKPALQDGFAVQVAAVRARDEAERMAAKLVQQGYSGYVVSGEGAAANYYRVRIGAFQDRHAAEDIARKIETAEGIKPWIVKESR